MEDSEPSTSSDSSNLAHQISSGAIIVHDDSILLVHHQKPGEFDFWVAPGGRLEREETVFECTVREVYEETGLTVTAQKILYIEQFIIDGIHFIKTWILCDYQGGELHQRNLESDEEFLVDTRFFTKDQLADIEVYPEVLKQEFWSDLKNGFPETRYLGLNCYDL